MSVILKKTWQTYVSIYERADVRTIDYWPGPGAFVTILLSYLYFCRTLGPQYMKHRKPYELKSIILVYNFLQVILSTYMLYEGLMAGWLFEYNWTCQLVDNSDNPTSRRMISVVWVYLIAKFTELLDTVFFVLRKKTRQISGLHMYHHFMMPIASWWALKYYPNGHGTLLGVINSFVHIVMYSYYLIAGLGPKYQKYLWWKKHLTTLQLIQFFIVFCHNFIPIFTDCEYPKWINVSLSLGSLHFVYMFGCFYHENYIKTKPKKISTSSNQFASKGNKKAN